MMICKECRCFHPVSVSDRYCGECVIGDTRNPIEINDEITGCCLFESNKPVFEKAYSCLGSGVIYCNDCDMIFTLDPVESTDEDIIKAWNRRADNGFD